MSIKYEGKDLKNTELVSYESKNFIRVSNESKDVYLDFEYFPEVHKDVEYDNYQIFVLSNNYLVAEKDFFQIYNKDDSRRLGWIFTISNLESKELDLIKDKHLNNYKLAAYYLLLQAKGNVKPKPIEEAAPYPKISDIYDRDDIFIVVYDASKKEFPIRNYLPSLSKYGYYIKNSYDNIAKIESKRSFCLKLREEGKNKIHLKMSNCGNDNDRFINDLFSDHLKSSEHHLLRFHILYQVIEFYLSNIFENDSKSIIDSYIRDRNDINGFMEKIGKVKSERTRINKLISYTGTLGDDLDYSVVNLQRDCDLFLRKCQREPKSNLGDLVYDVRNLIVHEYRSVAPSEFSLLEDITSEIELLVTNIIENYNFNKEPLQTNVSELSVPMNSSNS